MKTFRSRTARLSAVVTGKAKEVGSVEAHERSVLAITKRIHSLALRQAAIKKELATIKAELRFKRRELRAVLQRDSTMTDTDDRLETAGKADAIDAAEHRRES